MKITFSLLITLSLLTFILTAAQQKDIRPNVKDLLGEAKLVKPLIEKPYIPTEVEKLEVKKKTLPISEMKTAELVGNSTQTEKTQEKPTIYSTVIKSRPTSISRPQPVRQQISINVQQQPLMPGMFSVPVKIENNFNNPTLSGYDTPQFKGQRKENEIQEMLVKDYEMIRSGVQEGDRVKALEKAVENIKEEKGKIEEMIQKEKEEIKQIERVSEKMKNVLAMLENKIKHN